jgi:hypothetical protein
MYRSRGFRLIRILAVLAFLMASCGGSDEAAEDATTTTAGSSSEDTSTTASETTTTTAAAVSGDSDSEYCDRVREAEASDESPLDFSFFGSSPEEIEAQFERNLEIFAEWPAIAPPEIKADAETVYDFYRQLVERGNELSWNIQAMADDDFFNTSFDDPALDAATTNLDNYTRDVCGVDFTEQSTPPPSPPSTGADDALGEVLGDLGFPIPTEILSEEDLECLTNELEPLLDSEIGEGYVPTTEDIGLFINAVETCGIG